MTTRSLQVFTLVLFAGLTLALLAGACTGGLPATPATALDAEALTATAFCIQLTDTGENIALWAIFGTPTPPPGVTPPTPTPRTLPISGDPERGKALFNGQANCAVCHLVDSEDWFVGPSLKSVASRAGSKRADMDAKTYLYNVIVNPDLTIVPQVKAGVMPRTFEQKLQQQDIADIVYYLLTLRG